jgi:beta-mannosidase
MQYASTGGGSHGPIATATQEAELRHQIRRLSHHPSIVLWDGCNEVVVNPGTPSYVFATFVMTVVAQEDQSRVVWCACDPLTLPQIKLKRHLMKFN